MDEEFSDSEAPHSNQNRRSINRRSSFASLDRYSDFNREPSLHNRHSLIEVMSLEGSEVREDIYEFYEFEERRKSMIRNSNSSRMESGNQSSMDIEESRGFRRSSQNRGINHDCKCEGSCLQYHCPCYSEPDQLCLLGSCCLSCIQAKNQMMKSGTPPKIPCLCKNTKCMKQACRCFQTGEPCDPNICQCIGCQNAYNQKEKKDSQPPKKISKQNIKHQKNSGMACSCKKSHCLKKYCCCYAAGKECGPQCVCQDCHNQCDEEEDKEEKEYERQRYGRREDQQEQDIDKYFEQKDYDEDEMPASMEFEHPDMNLSYQRH